MSFLQTEKATYDPDLPHAFEPVRGSRDCRLCDRPRSEDLHQVEPVRQKAAQDLLTRELGS